MSDKKGKGSGTKDACYHKVKARYSVWPSAYASGALVKCRKKGAANWGNSTKKESFEIDPKKHKAAQKDQKIRNMTKSPNENEAKVAAKKAKGPKLMGEDKYDNLAKDISRVKLLSNAKPPADPKKTAEKKARLEKKRGMKLDDHPQYKEEVEISEAPYQVYGSPDGKKEKKIGKPVKSRKYADAKASELADFHKKTGGKYRSEYVEEVEQIEEKKKSGDPCWVGYKQVGMKKKGGKMVPNCVPEETEVSEGKKEMLAKMNASREGFMAKDGPNKAAHDAKQRILKKTKEKMTEEIVQSIFEKCWAGYEKKGMKTMFGKRYPNCVKKKATRKEEVELDERTRYAKETGKDPQTGKPSVKGGDEPSPAMKAVKSMAKQTGGLMSSRGKAIQPQGKKKVPGAKGLKGVTPADRIKGMLAKKRAPQPNPYKPRAGESD